MVNVDGSGPGYDVPSGSTLKHWWRIRELLLEAWHTMPRQEWPETWMSRLPSTTTGANGSTGWLSVGLLPGRTEAKPGRDAPKAVRISS